MATTPDKNLIDKFLQNKCTPHEAQAVLSWLSTPEGQEMAGKHFDSDVAKLDENEMAPDHPVPTLKMFRQIQEEINPREKTQVSKPRNIGRHWIRIAAAILIPLLLTNLLVWQIAKSPTAKVAWEEVYVPKGEKLQVLFQDGSRVWLNSDTRLRYPKAFAGKDRKVILEGEAYFSVSTDQKKPFMVSLSNNLVIKVTGTSFNVKAYADDPNIKTSLDEGKIILIRNSGIEHKLLPGQLALYNKSNEEISVVKSVIGENSVWKENKLVFDNTHLDELIKTLERWYNVKFEVDNKELLHYTYTIKFRNEPLQNVLFGLEKITPIKCTYKDGVVRIRKRANYN